MPKRYNDAKSEIIGELDKLLFYLADAQTALLALQARAGLIRSMVENMTRYAVTPELKDL